MMPEFSKIQAFIAAAITVVVGLFAAFEGFLNNIAPPDLPGAGAGKGLAVGTASFAALILLLLIQYMMIFLGTKRGTLALWLGVAALAAVTFMTMAVTYQGTLASKTFVHTPLQGGDSVIATLGNEYQPYVKEYLRTHIVTGPDELVQLTGKDDPGAVWTRSSIVASHTSMLRQYQILVVSLSLCLFALVSLLMAQRQPAAGPVAPASPPPDTDGQNK